LEKTKKTYEGWKKTVPPTKPKDLKPKTGSIDRVGEKREGVKVGGKEREEKEKKKKRKGKKEGKKGRKRRRKRGKKGERKENT